jgi:hypothetical protein
MLDLFSTLYNCRFVCNPLTVKLNDCSNSVFICMSICFFQFVLNRPFDISRTFDRSFWKVYGGKETLTYSCLQHMASSWELMGLIQQQ